MPILQRIRSLNILLTNDDGFEKEGFHVLKSIMASFGNVYVVCPDRDQSSTSHSLSIHKPLYFKEYHPQEYWVSGTPTDCVHFALHHLWEPSFFDLCVSGINHGANIGNDVWYSGTVGGAIEASLNGIRALAISQLSVLKVKTYDFEHARTFLSHWLKDYFEQWQSKHPLLNINIPPGHPEGFSWTKLGSNGYTSQIDARKDLRGRSYFWIGGELKDLKSPEGTDAFALSQAHVSVTPLSLDLSR